VENKWTKRETIVINISIQLVIWSKYVDRGTDKIPTLNQVVKFTLKLTPEFHSTKISKDKKKDMAKQILLIILAPFIPICLPKNKQIKKLIKGKYIISVYIRSL
jgi:hypothetical protein